MIKMILHLVLLLGDWRASGYAGGPLAARVSGASDAVMTWRLLAPSLVMLCAACATAPTRPTLRDLPPGPPLRDLLGTDVDPDSTVVDVTVAAATTTVVRAAVGDAVVVRGLDPVGTSLHVGGETVIVTDGVALLAPTTPGAYVMEMAGGMPRAILLVVAPEGLSGRDRVMLLDDRADGERVRGLGDILLVNAQPRPTLRVDPGSTESWHLFNVATHRVFTLALPGHLLVVDGRPSAEVSLAPGQRASLQVTFAHPAGSVVDLTTLDGDPDTQGDGVEAWPILRVSYVEKEPQK